MNHFGPSRKPLSGDDLELFLMMREARRARHRGRAKNKIRQLTPEERAANRARTQAGLDARRAAKTGMNKKMW